MRLSIISVFALLLASCGTNNKLKYSTEESIHKKWELRLLDGNEFRTNQPIYIEFSKDNKVSGFIGCNRLNGIYNIENRNQIRFSQLGVTRMACPENEMALEAQMLEILNTATSFTIENGKLNISGNNKESAAIFHRMSDNEIVNKYWKLKVLDGQEVQMAENQEREQYFTLRSDNTISGFAGCNYFNGTYNLEEGNRIRINDHLAVTMKACPDMALMESEFLEVFKLANNYTINEDTLNLNIGKRAPLAIFEAVYF